jgi:hypothetical protein
MVEFFNTKHQKFGLINSSENWRCCFKLSTHRYGTHGSIFFFGSRERGRRTHIKNELEQKFISAADTTISATQLVG